MNTSRRLQHQPALDGLRGLAVAGVVLFHAGYGWARGGYLGVSTFFTLSGFLITSLLLVEHDGTGRIDLPAFWGRRARRLLPAAMVTLGAVSALAAWVGTPEQLAGLRGDVLGALVYVANWRFILAGQSYGDLFSAPSPVLHFWSLAIEEQLYVLFPLLVVAVGAVRRRLVPVLCGLVVLSVVLAFVLFTPGGSTSAAYYGTFVRGGELFVGALLACVLAAIQRVQARQIAAKTAGVVALVGMVWLWHSVRQDETFLYRGGLLVHAVLAALVILACTADGGPVRAVLSWSPLRALGAISYGVYLYHWPIFVWVDAPVVVEIALALVAAVVSYRFLEMPIRRGRVRVSVLVAPVAALAVAGIVVASTLDPPRVQPFDLASASPPTPSEPIVEPAADAPRVAFFGDSTALRTGFALKGWGWTNGLVDTRDGGADVGCPLARGGIVDYVTVRQAPHDGCEDWPTTWASIVKDQDLDAAVIEIGPWDVTDRKLDGSSSWTHIGDPDYDRYLLSEMNRAVDALSANGNVVVWLTSPHIDFGRGQQGIDGDHPINDPRRMDRLNELIRQVDAERDEMVVLDLVDYLRSLPGDEMDPALRPDGVHFSEEASGDLVDWLGPAIIDAVEQHAG